MRRTFVMVMVGLVICSWATWASGAEETPTVKGPDEDGTKPALVKIAGEGEMNSHAFQYLRELSDEVGARVTGTPAAQKAVDWSAAKMKAIGLENVHVEKWQMWRGWARGAS